MKKRINIVLLIFVLGLWSIIIYRYVNRFFIKNELIFNNNGAISIGKLDSKGKDTFELKTIPRDPFLNKSNANSENFKIPTRRTVSTSKPNSKGPIIPIQFPMINYFGYIKSSGNKKELVLLKVNNKLLKYRVNEVKEGIKIIYINKDSVRVLFNQIEKTVKRNT